MLYSDNQSFVFFGKVVQKHPEIAPTIFSDMTNVKEQVNVSFLQEGMIRDEQIATLEAYLKTNPKTADVLYSLALLYKKNGKDEKANEFLKKALEINPYLKESF